jgi:hypothetical protein
MKTSKSSFKKPTSCDCSFCVKPNWLTKEEHIQEVGKFLGYPKCCTKAYIQNMHTNTSFSPKRYLAGQYKQSWSGGFIPCEKHAERIIDQGKSITRIFRNRVATTSFPYSSAKEFNRYLKKIKKQYVKPTKTRKN